MNKLCDELHETLARAAAKLMGYERGSFVCVQIEGRGSVMLKPWQIVALEWLHDVRFTPKARI